VTLGKGLALRVGPKGLFGELVAAYVGLRLDPSGTRCGLSVGLLLLCWRERIIVLAWWFVSLVR